MSKQDEPINPFEAAMANESADVTVMWRVEDIEAMRPDWPRERCERFLRHHADRFAMGMLRMGLSLLAEIAADPKYNGDCGGKKSETS